MFNSIDHTGIDSGPQSSLPIIGGGAPVGGSFIDQAYQNELIR